MPNGAGAVGLATVLGIKHEIPADFLVDVLVFGIPEKPMGDGFQVDGHGVKAGPPVLGHGAVLAPAVVKHENEAASLLPQDMFLDGVEIVISRELDVVFFGLGPSALGDVTPS